MIKFLLNFNLIVALTLLFPIQLFAAGPFDGIYSINLTSTSYVSVQENSSTGQMIVMLLDTESSDYSWSALTGIRNDNSVILDSIKGVSDVDIVSKAKVVFNSDGNATVTILSCIDGINYYCTVILPFLTGVCSRGF